MIKEKLKNNAFQKTADHTWTRCTDTLWCSAPRSATSGAPLYIFHHRPTDGTESLCTPQSDCQDLSPSDCDIQARFYRSCDTDQATLINELSVKILKETAQNQRTTETWWSQFSLPHERRCTGIPTTNFPDHGFQKLELTDTQTNRRDRTYYHLPRRMRKR